jgi:thymidylate kinase
MSNLPEKNNLLGIVGPCSAGKSTLIGRFQKQGFVCRHIAQEHSYVPEMWLKIVNPRVLIYLDVTYEISLQRKHLNLTPQEFEEQIKRLSHARQNAQIYLHTDPYSAEEVFRVVMASLEDLGIHPPQ